MQSALLMRDAGNTIRSIVLGVNGVSRALLLLMILATVVPSFWKSVAGGVVKTDLQKHKPEAEIINMTPAARVDEWVNEQVHHRFDLDDDQSILIRKYVLRDGTKALPRLTEIMDEYDPADRKKRSKGERFDAAFLLLSFIDRQAVRLRGSEEGRLAMKALERGIQRMRAAGFARKDGHAWEWVPDGRFEQAEAYLEEAKGIGFTDQAIRETFRLNSKLVMSDAELLEFSNFLVAHYPDYPSWSEKDFIKDPTRLSKAGYPLQVLVMKTPTRFYEAYSEFTKKKHPSTGSPNLDN
jgi:hypothetical protein